MYILGEGCRGNSSWFAAGNWLKRVPWSQAGTLGGWIESGVLAVGLGVLGLSQWLWIGRAAAERAGRASGDGSRAVRLRRGIFLGKQGKDAAGAGAAITHIRVRYRLKRPSVAFLPYFQDCFPEKSPLLHSTAREPSPDARPLVVPLADGAACLGGILCRKDFWIEG